MAPRELHERALSPRSIDTMHIYRIQQARFVASACIAAVVIPTCDRLSTRTRSGTSDSPNVQVLEPHIQPALHIVLEPNLRVHAELGGVADVAVGSDGRVYVADMTEQTVFVFSSEGAVLGRLGRKGEGPGEFQGLRDVVTRADTVFAFDQILQRVTAFAGGTVRQTVSLHDGSNRLARYDVLAPEDDGLLVQYITPHGSDEGAESGGTRSIVLRHIVTSHDGNLRSDDIMTIADSDWLVMRDGASGYSVSPMPFGSMTFVEVLPDGQLVVGRSAEAVLRVTDANGGDLRHILLPDDPVELTGNHLEALRQSYISFVGPQAASLVFRRVQQANAAGMLPERLPHYDDLRTDPRSRIWLRVITPRSSLASTSSGLRYVQRQGGAESRTTYWVVDADGSTLRRAVFTGDVMIAAFDDAHAWAIASDSLDVQTLVRFDITELHP